MTFFFRPTVLLLALAPAVGGVTAQDLPDSVHVLAPILIEAERPPASPVGVRSIRLGRDAVAGTDLLDVLEREAGLYAVRTGTGASASFRVRGTDDLQTAILLDGIALRDPHTGRLDPALVPRVVIESAEIGFGAASADPGTPTGPGLGGAVRLSSLNPEGCGGVRTEASAGAYGGRRGGARIAAGSRRLCLLVAAERGQERGDYPVPGIPGAPVRRLGAERSHDSGFARLSGAIRAVRWSLTGWRSRSDAGLPGPANSTPRGAEMNLETRRGAFSVRRTGARLDLGLALHAAHSVSTFRDPAAERRSQAEATSLQGDLSASASPGGWRLESRAIFGLERSIQPTADAQRRAVMDLSATRSNRIGELTLGLAVGTWPGAGFRAAPRVSAGTSGRWSVRASVARAVRSPTLAERTWVPGGNPDLRPETGWSADAGTRLSTRSNWTLDVGVFLNVVRDRIVWQPRLVAPGLDLWTPSNVGRSLGLGVEASIGNVLETGVGRLRLGLGGTVSRTTDRSDPLAASYGHPLRHLPASTWSAVAEWSRGVGALRLDGRRVGRRPVTSDATRHLPAFTVVDLSGSVALGRPLRLRASLRNLLGARYAMIPLYPMPGRHLTVTLTMDLLTR